MSLSMTKVQCGGCGKLVEKSQTFPTLDASREMRFQCGSCVKNSKKDLGLEPAKKAEAPLKKELFCGRCRYKFKSKTMLCPYCSKDDLVMERIGSVKDLL